MPNLQCKQHYLHLNQLKLNQAILIEKSKSSLNLIKHLKRVKNICDCIPSWLVRVKEMNNIIKKLI